MNYLITQLKTPLPFTYKAFLMKMKLHCRASLFQLFCLFLVMLITNNCFSQLLKVGVAGLNHDHAYGLMNQYKNKEVLIIGIAEADKQLVNRYKQTYQLPDSI